MKTTSLTIAASALAAVLGWLASPGLASAQNAIFVEPGGEVGVGTSTPSSALHVFSSGSGVFAGRILAHNSSGPVARVLVDLINKGNVTFMLRDTGAPAVDWQLGNLSNSPIDGFVISRQGDGVNEFIIKDNGDVYIENGTVIVTSSRDVKENFSRLAPEEVLDKLSRLPITIWNYKKDDAQVRHIGPVAEEFYALFGLGADDKHVSFGDTSGVALAAVQALSQQKDALRQQVDQLREENAELRQRLEVIEKTLLVAREQ
ncbi:MAG TPA: tail fiber domain-containing protein [Thermoanaerobaculia bacterium]